MIQLFMMLAFLGLILLDMGCFSRAYHAFLMMFILKEHNAGRKVKEIEDLPDPPFWSKLPFGGIIFYFKVRKERAIVSELEEKAFVKELLEEKK